MENKKTNLERRHFFKVGAASLASLFLLPALDRKGISWAARADDASLPDLTEKDPMAVSLGYVKVAAKTDVTKFPKRADAAAKKEQFCKNCQFYTSVNAKKGKCQIFVGKLVESGGWCNTWTKKPA